jgi:hypothetical protein
MHFANVDHNTKVDMVLALAFFQTQVRFAQLWFYCRGINEV